MQEEEGVPSQSVNNGGRMRVMMSDNCVWVWREKIKSEDVQDKVKCYKKDRLDEAGFRKSNINATVSELEFNKETTTWLNELFF